jgi:hypothetical protein
MGVSSNLYINLHYSEWWMVRFVGWLAIGPDRLASGKFEYRSRKFHDCGWLKSALLGGKTTGNNMEGFLLMLRVSALRHLNRTAHTHY